jgi:transposase-like protein
MDAPKTLQQAIVYFSDPERAFIHAVNLRWPDKHITCPRCGHDKHSFIKTRLLWFCKGCKKQFTVKVGSIFEDSALGLDKWMTAIWLLVNCKNGISSYELHRALGVTQKSAWFMLQRIRLILHDKTAAKKKIGGEGSEVEVDETFIGGKVKNMHKARKLRLQNVRNEIRNSYDAPRYMGKTAVMGMLDRENRTVRAMVVPNTKRETLQNAILNEVSSGSKVYTDQAVVYDKLAMHYTHEMVNHLEGYVKGRVSTNGLENFWSLLKRSLHGTYVSVEPFHLFRYVDEQAFRYNNRLEMTDANRFSKAMNHVSGRRLTYAELTGKDQSPRKQSTGARETSVPF